MLEQFNSPASISSCVAFNAYLIKTPGAVLDTEDIIKCKELSNTLTVDSNVGTPAVTVTFNSLTREGAKNLLHAMARIVVGLLTIGLLLSS
jgi:hypothetical protein